MEDFLLFINTSTDKLKLEEERLIRDERKDEANLTRIRLNIYDIAGTIYAALSKQGRGEINSEEYLKKLENLGEKWRESYEKAKIHNDMEKMAIEEIKLETLETIKSRYQKRD